MSNKKISKAGNYFRSVEFYKSVQFSARDLGGDYFIALGNLQYMRPKTDGDLIHALDIAKSKFITDVGGENERLYAKHSLHFFCFDDKEDSKDYIIGFPEDESRSLERKDHFYIVTTLNLDRRTSIFESYDEFFLSVKREVNHKLNELGINARLYAGLGSNDLILLAKSLDFRKLLSLPYELRKVRHKSTSDRIFIDSHSIPLVHYNFDLKEIEKIPKTFSVELRYELLDIEQESNLLGIYQELFPELTTEKVNEKGGNWRGSLTCTRRYGTYDISMYLSLPSLYKVFYILGVRGENAKKALIEKLGKINFDAFHNNVELLERFGSKYIGLHLRRLSGPKIAATEPLTEIREVFAQTNPPYLQLAGRMDLLIKEIRSKIPKRALRTLNFIYTGCIDLLGTEKKELSGFRMYTLFNRTLNLIADGHFEGAAIIKALGTLSSALNDIMLADNVDFENIMDLDPETLSPSIKLYHAFERSVEVIFNALSSGNDTKKVSQRSTKIFLNLNPVDGFSTHPLLSRKGEFGVDLLMINLPDVSYLDPEHSFVLLAHEIGHYVNIAKISNIDSDGKIFGNELLDGIYVGERNKALFEMVKFYAKTICYSYASGLVSANRLNEVRRIVVNLIDFLAKVVEENCLEPTQFETTTAAFAMSCQPIVSNMQDYARKYKNEIMSILHSYSEAFDKPFLTGLFQSVIIGLGRIAESVELIHSIYKHIIQEAQADVFMCELCDLDVKDYFAYHAIYQNEGGVQEYKFDDTYLIRLASVYKVLYDKYGKSEKEIISDLTPEEYQLFKLTKAHLRDNEEFIAPLLDYLRNHVQEYLREKINSIDVGDDDEVRTVLRIFRTSKKLRGLSASKDTGTFIGNAEGDLQKLKYELIQDLHKQWYYNMISLRGEYSRETKENE